MIEITNHPIAADRLLKSVQSNLAGASVLFVGTTRQFTNGRETSRLEYECYEAMAIKKMTQLHDQARKKWPLEHCSIVHRVGPVEIGESSIMVAVSTPHRVDGFQAAQWLVDQLKELVPIWKQEHWTDGDQEWIHPEETTSDQTTSDHS